MQWLQHTRTLNTKLSFRWLIELFPGGWGSTSSNSHMLSYENGRSRVLSRLVPSTTRASRWHQVDPSGKAKREVWRKLQSRGGEVLRIFVCVCAVFPEKFSWGFSLVATEVPILQDLSWCRKLTRQHGNVALLLHHGDQAVDMRC